MPLSGIECSALQEQTSEVPEPRVLLDTGVTLHYQSIGVGRPVVFVPGWTCSLEFFSKQVDALKSSHRIVRLDPRGQGQSEKTAEGHNFRQRGRDLAALIAALGLDKVVLVGWSYGSYDVWEYIRQFGLSKVCGLVVIDQPPQSPYDPEDSAAWGEVALTADGAHPSGASAMVRAVVDTRTAFWTAYVKYMLNMPQSTPDDDPDVSLIVSWGLRTPQAVAIQTFADGAFADFTEVAREVDNKVPVAFFVRKDWEGVAQAWISANMPASRVVPISCHMAFWVDDDAFNEELLSFISTPLPISGSKAV